MTHYRQTSKSKAQRKDAKICMRKKKCLNMIVFKGLPIRLTSDFSSGTQPVRRKWREIVQVLKEKTVNPEYDMKQSSHFYMMAKLSFICDGKALIHT